MKRNYEKIMNNVFDTCNDIIETAEGQNAASINESAILTKLIQSVGKSTERWASDLFITWLSVLQAMKNLSPYSSDEAVVGGYKIFTFGVREDGVDGNEYTVLRLMSTSPLRTEEFEKIQNEYYRHIFVLKIETTENGLLMTLKNVQQSITPSLVFGVKNGEITFS